MRGLRAVLAPAVILLLAGPALAEPPQMAKRPLARPGIAYSTASANVPAALAAGGAVAPTPRANPRGPAAGASLAGAAMSGGAATPSRLGVPAAAQAPTLAALLDADHARPRPTSLAAATPAPEVTRLAALPAIRALPRPAAAAALAPQSKAAASLAAAPIAAAPLRQARMPEQIQQAAFVAPVPPDVLTTRKGALCGLASLQGRRIAPITSRVKGCGVADPVEVTAVDGVPLSMPATVDCGTAIAIDRWVKTGLKRAIGGQGGGLAKIQIAGSYTCRPMNNIRGNKISEHGRGRAIDVSGVVLKNGESYSIARDWRKSDAAFMRAAYRSACGIFGTTLGPGSDGHHEDHLHFDTAVHRKPYCR